MAISVPLRHTQTQPSTLQWCKAINGYRIWLEILLNLPWAHTFGNVYSTIVISDCLSHKHWTCSCDSQVMCALYRTNYIYLWLFMLLLIIYFFMYFIIFEFEELSHLPLFLSAWFLFFLLSRSTSGVRGVKVFIGNCAEGYYMWVIPVMQRRILFSPATILEEVITNITGISFSSSSFITINISSECLKQYSWKYCFNW